MINCDLKIMEFLLNVTDINNIINKNLCSLPVSVTIFNLIRLIPFNCFDFGYENGLDPSLYIKIFLE